MSHDDDMLWRRVNDALDRRVDPLDDAEVQRILVESPDRIDEVVRIVSLAAELSEQDEVAVASARGRGRRVPVAAAAAMLIAAALLLTRAPSPVDPSSFGALPPTVLDYRGHGLHRVGARRIAAGVVARRRRPGDHDRHATSSSGRSRRRPVSRASASQKRHAVVRDGPDPLTVLSEENLR